ncbi:MAG TPA: peptidylprolyl isomerase [Candidatus Angelobacter sp.]|nr:peptidylprolyl isomerase [Candidatus Angelobacter sp.]
MIRAVFRSAVVLISASLAFAQYPGPPGQKPPAAPPQAAQASTEEVPFDAVIVSVHGLCPPGKAAANADSCTTTLTRQQFETMLKVMNVTNQNYSPAALKGIAESYVHLLVLADAGEKAGLEKDPRFQEMMSIARVRTMAELYRQTLDEKFSAPAAETLESYYKDNIQKYEQLKIDRVFIPLADPKKPQERAVFEKKARRLAEELRERAGKGEDMGALQEEGYKTLGLSLPPKADQGPKRKGNYPPALEKDIFSLKPAEVTKVETDLSGFSFYKVRTREAIPLELVKPEVTRELYQKNMEAAMKAANSQVRSDFNDKYFKPHVAGPMAPTMRPAPHVTIEGPPQNAPGSAAQTNPGAQTPPK